MPDMPALPIWDVLYLSGISLVLTGYLADLLDDGVEAEAAGELPALADPFAEV